MTPEQTNELFRSLGRIEARLDSMDLRIAAQANDGVARMDHLESRIEPLEKMGWRVGGVLAAAAVAFEVTVRFIL